MGKVEVQIERYVDGGEGFECVGADEEEEEEDGEEEEEEEGES